VLKLLLFLVTTCRKAVTIAFSFIFFAKPFTYQYLWAGLLVSVGIYLNLFSKNREKWEDVFVRCYTQFKNVSLKYVCRFCVKKLINPRKNRYSDNFV